MNWVARFSYVDAAGTKRAYFKRGFATQAEAEAHEREVRAGIKAARELLNIPKEAMTFGDWARRWKETTLRISTRASGYERREGQVRLHLIPALGHIPLAALRKSHGEQFKLHLASKGLKPRSQNHLITLTKQILSDAVDEELLDRNPWQRLRGVPVPADEWDWYRPDELARFLDAVREDYPQWLLEILLGCRAGLRAGEVAGLFVEDCDLRIGAFRVRRDVVKRFVQPPKSRTGSRTIHAPRDLLTELVRRSRYALLRPAITVKGVDGRMHHGHPLVFTRSGELHKYLPTTMERAITGAAKKAGLRRLTHRDLRHTYASHLRLCGRPIEEIRDLLGHSTLQMTLRYAHITADRFAEAAAALEGMGL
jgi:integrase